VLSRRKVGVWVSSTVVIVVVFASESMSAAALEKLMEAFACRSIVLLYLRSRLLLLLLFVRCWCWR